jgi:3'-phosphoadenosine 5'-phosphosulfate (PAPS) 3'-phosphatase
VLGWLYAGGEGLGARKSMIRVTWDELWAHAQHLPARLPDAVTVVASRSHSTPETEALIARWEASHGSIQRVSMGSSLKIGLVAEGRAHAYPRAAPTMEWDTAAGHAVLRGAGMEPRAWISPRIAFVLQQRKLTESALPCLRCPVSLWGCVTSGFCSNFAWPFRS